MKWKIPKDFISAANEAVTDIAFRNGCDWGKEQILELLRAKIAELEVAGEDTSRSPTDRCVQRMFAEMFEGLEKEIDTLVLYES